MRKEPIGLVIPVLNNFKGVAELFHSVDHPILPLVIHNWTENRGVSGGWNDGIEAAIRLGYDKVIVSNDDITFYPGCIEKLSQSLDTMPFVTATAANSGMPPDEEVYVESPDFSCFAIRPKEFIDRVGWFDEAFRPAYFEDNDMHWRMRQADIYGARRLNANTYHQVSQTQKNSPGDPPVPPSVFLRNQLYYVGKWGGIPGEEKYTQPFNDPTLSYKDIVR